MSTRCCDSNISIASTQKKVAPVITWGERLYNRTDFVTNSELGPKMTKSHRINITLSEADYRALVALAESRGSMPTTEAGDIVRMALRGPSMPPPKRLHDGPECTCTVTDFERMEDRSCPVHFPKASLSLVTPSQAPGLSRAERRALERGKQKKRG